MKQLFKIDSVNIRRSRFNIIGVVYSHGYAYAVRFAPNTAVTEDFIRKVWRESRNSFRNYDDEIDSFIS